LFAEHHYVAAATMNFDPSKTKVIRWKASQDAFNQLPLKAGKLGSGSNPHFTREERCLFKKICHKRTHGRF
jgi:hypothetical protein